jgi:outer membrane protein TolC
MLTVPVSGIKGLEKKVAQAYSEADMWMLRNAETVAMAEAEILNIRLWNAHHRVHSARVKTRRVDKYHTVFKNLAAAGELPDISQLHDVRQRLVEAQASQKKIGLAYHAAAQELMAFLGLQPKTPWSLWNLDLRADNVEREILPEDLIRHPRVMAALAKLNMSEAELKLEIRKQYPDLVIGSALGREEGQNRAGLVAGISLPLWNRNRAAIAHAEGERAVSRQDVIHEWKALVQAYEIAVEHYRNTREIDALAFDGYKTAENARDDSDTLFRAGEISAMDALEAEERLMATWFDMRDTAEAFGEAVVRLRVIMSEE